MNSPSAAQFARALQQITPQERWLKLLRIHVGLKGKATTATALGRLVGYTDHRGVNAAYGALAAKLGAVLNRPEDRIGLLMEFLPPTSVTNKEWVLVLRPEFIDALTRVGWV